MKPFTSLLFLVLGMNIYAQKTYDYPEAPKDPIADTYFGESVEDPYQWMENPDDPRLEEWLKEQRKIIRKQSSKQTNYWNLRAQIAAMFNIRREKTEDYRRLDEKFRSKFSFKSDWNSYTGSMDFLYKLRTEKNWKRLFRGKDLLENRGDHIAINERVVNSDENLIAISVSINGSDWATGYVFDLTTGTQFPYVIENLRTGSNFEWNGRDLYYTSFDKPEKGRELLDISKGQTLYRISISNRDSRPELCYKNPDTTGKYKFSYNIQEEKLSLYHYLKSRGTWYEAISIADLKKVNFQPRRFLVFPPEDGASLRIVHTSNDSVFLRTNIGAPNGKILLANVNNPNQLSEFVPEYDINLRYANKLGKDKLACVYNKDGQDIALIFNFKGELLKKIDFPTGKKLNYFYENSDDAEFTNFSISSFFHPNSRYQIDLNTLEFTPVEALSVPFNIENLETRHVTFKSKDGTEIPMYITCYKETTLDGNNPVLMYGYGGYGIRVEPDFNELTGLLLAHGGILAVPNVRGGGANGSDWALAGRGLKKQNTIDDFIAAGEYLINQKYTSPEKLVISGGSHGALLVEAAATQRPELFKAVIAEAGPYDMLRFNRFTIGSSIINLKEFSSPDNEEGFKYIRSYSPLHQLKKGRKYPNTLLITGDTDDRVPPLHSYKFLASLQEKGDPSGLYQLYITPGSGHGGALSPEDAVEKFLFEYYFMFEQMGIEL
ncbi:prolyl oligopeptidase family serine peptidase [Gramella sp. GC03-9]|uniref:prolyl oligopeptidase n=1 Tax=Christiangramia oceanisediminis TaxID=2920386 RepID=A0A9X2I6Y9_9FLAO|nr:prolyl oligopeptidase family serine peptidase [Gramella oceanisediminis]MCP9198819.1 prolyl oligopeptidase family serine peptidase [Gramella oceanisediminis]